MTIQQWQRASEVVHYASLVIVWGATIALLFGLGQGWHFTAALAIGCTLRVPWHLINQHVDLLFAAHMNKLTQQLEEFDRNYRQ